MCSPCTVACEVNSSSCLIKWLNKWHFKAENTPWNKSLISYSICALSTEYFQITWFQKAKDSAKYVYLQGNWTFSWKQYCHFIRIANSSLELKILLVDYIYILQRISTVCFQKDYDTNPAKIGSKYNMKELLVCEVFPNHFSTFCCRNRMAERVEG